MFSLGLLWHTTAYSTTRAVTRTLQETGTIKQLLVMLEHYAKHGVYPVQITRIMIQQKQAAPRHVTTGNIPGSFLVRGSLDVRLL